MGDNGSVTPTRPADDRLHVCVVCSGNICRSPIGEQVLRAEIARAGLDDRVRVSSAGTGDWHLGQPADHRTSRALRAAGYPDAVHQARMITRRELAAVDLALAADRGHLRDLRRLTDDPDKVALIRSFDPDADGDEVPDPFYGSDAGFSDVLAMTEAAVPGILTEIRRRLADRERRGAGAVGSPHPAAKPSR